MEPRRHEGIDFAEAWCGLKAKDQTNGRRYALLATSARLCPKTHRGYGRGGARAFEMSEAWTNLATVEADVTTQAAAEWTLHQIALIGLRRT
jgi:hypothetical protein